MILLLETSTLNCSVALGQRDGTPIGTREVSDGQYLHAEKLHVLIDELLRAEGMGPKDLSAIAVGKGPGSFTGLRIGVSAAKGMCTALGLPLLAPCPLKGLQRQGGLHHPQLAAQPARIVPAIDARRLEIYTLSAEGHPTASIVDGAFRSDLGPGPALLVGDGAEKCRDVLGRPRLPNGISCRPLPTAADLLPEAACPPRIRATPRTSPTSSPSTSKTLSPDRPKDPLGLRSKTS